MALFDDLKTAIKQAIKPNNAQEITGQTLQNTLLQMVDDLGTMPPEDFEAWKGQVTEQIEDCATKEEVTEQLGGYATKTELQPLASIAKGTIVLNVQYDTLDQYNSIDKKGWYALSRNDSGIWKDAGGFMLVTADDMGHVIHQFIFSDYTVMDGEIGSHQDGTPSIVVRTYNVNSSIKDIPKGTWGKWTNYFGLSRQTGYAECISAANDAGKLVHFSDYREFELSINCRILVKMEQANSAANPTMNIDNTGAKPLFYNGSPVSASNTWQAGDILDVYYDGTNYHAIRFGLEFPQSKVTGYAVCSSGASIASKRINRTNFELSDNCRLLVEMNNANSAASGVTLNINNTGAKPLFYNGSPVSASNTWQAGDILDVYYDGTYYHAIRFGLVDTYPPLFLTMSKSGTKDVLEGATPIVLREALSAGRNVIITDQNQKDNYVVSVSYSPLAITVCNPNGKLMRLDLVTDDGIIEYTQTDLSQYSPLVLDIQGNNMPIAGTTTMRDISLAITHKQPLYVNYNNKTNRVIAYDPIQSSITLYYHDVGYKGIVRVDLIGEDTAVPTSRLTPMPKDYDNAALVLDVSNCWQTTQGTHNYEGVDLGMTFTEIATAINSNRRIILFASGSNSHMYPSDAGEQGTVLIIQGFAGFLHYLMAVQPDTEDPQKCKVMLQIATLKYDSSTGA